MEKNIKNLECFKEFSKSITREEFKDDCLKYREEANDYSCSIKGEWIDCPTSIAIPCTCSKYNDCRKCWTDSVKDIYFKDDIEKSKLNNDNTYEIVKDYEKEYSLHEVFEFKEGAIFKLNEYQVKMVNGTLYYYVKKDNWYECYLDKYWLDGKYKLIPFEKEVSFQEVLEYGVKCRVEYKGEFEDSIKGYNDINVLLRRISDLSIPPQFRELIKYGKWFIKECE